MAAAYRPPPRISRTRVCAASVSGGDLVMPDKKSAAESHAVPRSPLAPGRRWSLPLRGHAVRDVLRNSPRNQDRCPEIRVRYAGARWASTRAGRSICSGWGSILRCACRLEPVLFPDCPSPGHPVAIERLFGSQRAAVTRGGDVAKGTCPQRQRPGSHKRPCTYRCRVARSWGSRSEPSKRRVGDPRC